MSTYVCLPITSLKIIETFMTTKVITIKSFNDFDLCSTVIEIPFVIVFNNEKEKQHVLDGNLKLKKVILYSMSIILHFVGEISSWMTMKYVSRKTSQL